MPIVNGTWVSYNTSFCSNSTYIQNHLPLECLIKTVTYNISWFPIAIFGLLFFGLGVGVVRKNLGLVIISIALMVIFGIAFLYQ